MIKLERMSNNSILTVNDVEFIISNELADFIEATNSLNDETIETTTSKTGVTTLKIKSLTYSINDKKKVLNIYKTNSNLKEKKTMKVFIKFYKKNNANTKTENKKPTKFESLIFRTVRPALKDKEFASMDEVKTTVYDILKPLMSEESKWEIEDNTKQPGLVIKNTYNKEGFEKPSFNMFFINVETEKA